MKQETMTVQLVRNQKLHLVHGGVPKCAGRRYVTELAASREVDSLELGLARYEYMQAQRRQLLVELAQKMSEQQRLSLCEVCTGGPDSNFAHGRI